MGFWKIYAQSQVTSSSLLGCFTWFLLLFRLCFRWVFFPKQRVVTPAGSPGDRRCWRWGAGAGPPSPVPRAHTGPKLATPTWSHAFSWYLSWHFALREYVSWKARTDFASPCLCATSGAWSKWERETRWCFPKSPPVGSSHFERIVSFQGHCKPGTTHPDIIFEGQTCNWS